MKNRKTFIVLGLLIAVLMLGIGYAAISNITLTITGETAANPSDDNFVVRFDRATEDDEGTAPTTTKSVSTANVTAAYVDDHNASINVSGLTAKGDYVTATYTIENNSPDLWANLDVITEATTNEEYFAVTAELADEVLENGGDQTTVTVRVELIKTPITAAVNGTATVQVQASPDQPAADSE